MKKSLFILLLSIFITTQAYAKLNVIVSIQPQMEFVNKIGGDKINSTLMVPVGSSPHTYEPKPSQMKSLSDAHLYLAIGVEFEKVWLDKFKNQNAQLVIADTSKDINKTAMESHGHHHGDESAKHLDPHIWVNPLHVKTISQNIFEALSRADSNNTAYYKKNLENYLKELDQLDRDIKKILAETAKDSLFMVFHPAWGYFAEQYHLHQLAIEIEGKSPKPRQLIKIIQEAKAKKVKAIFTQPEFSDKAAQTIAKTLNIQVIKSSPLAKNWSENLKKLAKAIASKKQK